MVQYSAEGHNTDNPAQALTTEEDDELRRLNALAQLGSLSPTSVERLLALRLRDRRTTIRRPRDVVGEQKEVERSRRNVIGQ